MVAAKFLAFFASWRFKLEFFDRQDAKNAKLRQESLTSSALTS